MAHIEVDDHKSWMRHALSLAEQSPAKPSNYRVGAVLIDAESHEVLATGYSLELPGNTHAEQCCFMKMAEEHGIPEEKLKEVAPANMILYTTMEPCSKRLSGNTPCVERILRLAGSIRTVYVGVFEPEKFVTNTGKKTLEDAGVAFVHISGFEEEILSVATAGHVREG